MRRTSFCNDWEFSRDGEEFAPVVVPHDAMLDAPRGPAAPGGSASGYYYGTDFHYRKTFETSAARVIIEFEAIYRNAKIRVNGHDVEAPPYGFMPFLVDVSKFMHTGENVIEVSGSNADQPDCRWYSGAGITRPVWLWEGEQASIAPEGVRITTESIDPAVVRVDVECTGGSPRIAIFDANSNPVCEGEGKHVRFTIADAQLWSAEDPYRYHCQVELHDGDAVVDTASVAFGVRTIEWSSKGLFVNGESTLLRGGCIHCDNGILGAVSFAGIERWRIERMKEAGFNAVRIAHNPAPSALLEACDELGMYVMDEMWDVWFTRKSAHDYSRDFLDWFDYDLAQLASRDYNHPSVIMYSIGNEIADPLSESGIALERSMVDLLHSLDPTRPVTCGLNLTMMVMERAGRGWYDDADGVAADAQSSDAPRGSLMFNMAAQATGSGMTLIANAPGADKLVSPALDALDIAGYNYASARYGIDARKHPDRIIVGSETFPHELYKNWRKVERIDSLIGDFMWAGWDYLGEAGAGAWSYTAEEAGFSKPWPWLIAGSGAFDLLGEPNAHAALASAAWKARSAPSIQVRPVNVMAGRTYKATWRGSDAIPSWSWRGCEGATTQVEVYDGRAHSVRLELNGLVMGTKRLRKCVAKFSIGYQPGTLVARTYDKAGAELGVDQLNSATGGLRLSLRELFSGASGQVTLIMVEIVGENGVVESNADELLMARVEGGELLAFGSARPATRERFTSGSYTAYRGRAMAAVYRATPGDAQLSISGATLGSALAMIHFD